MKVWRRVCALVSMFCMTLFAVLIIGGTCLLIVYVIQNKGIQNLGLRATNGIEDEDIEDHTVVEIAEESTALSNYEGFALDESELIDGGQQDSLLEDEETMRAQRIYQVETNTPGELSMVFAGDMLFDPGYAVMGTYLNRGGQLENAFSADVIQTMQSADICMINNEFPYSRRGAPLQGKTYTFRADPSSVSILQELGVDIVSMANNHAMDYGTDSLVDSIVTLRNAGILYAGAGLNYEEASHPIYYITNEVKVAYVAATQIEQTDNPDTKGATETSPGVHRAWNDDRIFDVIRTAKDNADFVVLYIHWGTESTTELSWGQTYYVNRYIEAGADLIIGDHPHVLQGIDCVNGVPVIYSLGNFWFNSKGRDTCMVRCTLDHNGLKSFQFIPCAERECMTIMLHDDEKERVLQHERNISPNVQLDGDGYLQLSQ